MAKLKPEVIYIKGVHSTTGNDQEPDIGFPQLHLEKLFENIVIEQIGASESYDNDKSYVYKENNEYKPIENEYHFDCIKNGYYVITNNEDNTESNDIDRYYTKENNNYIYHIIPKTKPNTWTWKERFDFSNEIKNINLDFIKPEQGKDDKRIYIKDNGSNYYYNKDKNNNYIKVTSQVKYSVLEEVVIDWDNSKCHQENKWIPDPNAPGEQIQVSIWKLGKNNCKNGLYISIKNIDSYWEFKLLNLEFDDGQLANNGSIPLSADLYKLSNNFTNSIIYVLTTNDILASVTVGTLDNAIGINNFNNNNKKLYNKVDTWSYPNTFLPSYNCLMDLNGIYYFWSDKTFPLYSTEALKTNIEKTKINSHSIFKKTTIAINYKYKKTSNNLQFIFTDKTKDDVLDMCGLKAAYLNNININKYVHFTNLEYNR